MPLPISEAGGMERRLALLFESAIWGQGHRCWQVTWLETLLPLSSAGESPVRPLSHGFTPVIRAQKIISPGHGDFHLPQGALVTSLISRLPRVLLALAIWAIIIEANLFFKIFYWIFSSLTQT